MLLYPTLWGLPGHQLEEVTGCTKGGLAREDTGFTAGLRVTGGCLCGPRRGCEAADGGLDFSTGISLPESLFSPFCKMEMLPSPKISV